MNNSQLKKIGFGGGCHWCTEGIFQSLVGVEKVEQGWIATKEEPNRYSEAVIVHYEPTRITLECLLEIHLNTHSSTSPHHLREKYRSAVYCFNEQQLKKISALLQNFQASFNKQLITKALKFGRFKMNQPDFINYLYTNPERQFCKRYIHPKLNYLKQHYSDNIDHSKITFLTETKLK